MMMMTEGEREKNQQNKELDEKRKENGIHSEKTFCESSRDD